jgi:penicillin amidase
MQSITPQDMMTLQGDNFSTVAEDAVPLLLKNINEGTLNSKELFYLNEVKKWNYDVTATMIAPTIYQAWIDSLKMFIWRDEFSKINEPTTMPDEQTMVEILLRDSAFRFVDNINTASRETLPQQVTTAFRAVASYLSTVDDDSLVWWKHKNSSILHLLRESLLPFGKVGLQVGGWGTTINASTKYKGPSWKMIVHLTTPTEAYGVYPGGQNGNPGSRFYDHFINTWVSGKYYSLWLMKETEQDDKRIRWKINFTNV